MAFASHLCIILLTCICTGNISIGDKDNVIKPKFPVLRVGMDINLTCTMPDVLLTKYDSSDALFTLGHIQIDVINATTIDSRYIFTVVDDRTISITIINITYIQYNNKHLYCYVYDGTKSGPNRYILIGQNVLKVTGDILIPNITECIVYNWIKMMCIWQPPFQDGYEQYLFWSIRPGMMRRCKQPRRCTVPAEFYRDLTYLNLYTRYLSNASYNLVRTQHTEYIVKPDPPSNLRVHIFNTSDVIIKWTAPHPLHYVEFRFLLFSVDDDYRLIQENIISSNSTDKINKMENRKSISSLKAYGRYNVSIDSIPVIDDIRRGYWSNTSSVLFTMDQAVPLSYPVIAHGSFQYHSRNVTQRTIQLFWKDVPRLEIRGVMSQCRVRAYIIQNGTTGTTPSIVVTSNGYTASSLITLLHSESYQIAIEVATIIGYNDTIEPHYIMIPREDKVPQVVSDFSVQTNTTHVFLDWKTNTAKAISNTIFWCLGSLHNFKCKDTMHDVEIPANVSSHSIHIEREYDQYLFGISSEQLVTLPRGRTIISSSGIHWSKCTHILNKDIQAPTRIRIDTNSVNSLTILWLNPSCKNTGYINHYIIRYCRHKHLCSYAEVQNTENRVFLDDLTGGVKYSLSVFSVGFNENVSSIVVNALVNKGGLSKKVANMIIIACCFIAIFIVIGFIATYKRCKLWLDNFIKVKILVPQHAADASQNGHDQDEKAEFIDNKDNEMRIGYYSRNNSESNEDADSCDDGDLELIPYIKDHYSDISRNLHHRRSDRIQCSVDPTTVQAHYTPRTALPTTTSDDCATSTIDDYCKIDASVDSAEETPAGGATDLIQQTPPPPAMTFTPAQSRGYVMVVCDQAEPTPNPTTGYVTIAGMTPLV